MRLEGRKDLAAHLRRAWDRVYNPPAPATATPDASCNVRCAATVVPVVEEVSQRLADV